MEHAAILCDEPALMVPAALLASSRGSAMSAASRLARLCVIASNSDRAGAGGFERTRRGVQGRAARLGVPASTLESKIRRYRIDKLRFRTRRN